MGVPRQKGWKLRGRRHDGETGRKRGRRWGSLGGRYLQPIDVGQNVGVPESFEALEGSFGHLGLLVRTGLHIVHEDGHRAACGLRGGQRDLRDVGRAPATTPAPRGSQSCSVRGGKGHRRPLPRSALGHGAGPT